MNGSVCLLCPLRPGSFILSGGLRLPFAAEQKIMTPGYDFYNQTTKQQTTKSVSIKPHWVLIEMTLKLFHDHDLLTIFYFFLFGWLD